MNAFLKHSSAVCTVLLAAAVSIGLFASELNAQTPAPSPAKPMVDQKALEKAKDIIDTFNTDSVMFDKKDISAINKIIAAWMSGVRPDKPQEETKKDDKDDLLSNLLDQLGDKEQEALPKSYTFPSFYLSSIVIYSATDWAVWVNGFKFSNRNNKKVPPLYVESISSTKATLVWQPARSLLESIKEIEAKNKNRDRFVTFDASKGTYTFTLKPNETFVSGISSIKEGRVASIEISRKVQTVNGEGELSGEQATPEGQAPKLQGTQMPPGMGPGGMMPGNIPPMNNSGVPNTPGVFQGIKSTIGSEMPIPGLSNQQIPGVPQQ